MSTLVIVESPTKARTIRNFLPSGYRVEASMGHVRDLPQSASDIPANLKSEEWSRLGVNVQADFEPLYIVPDDKKKIVRELKSALKEATELILATDEDREGESISWHLLQVLQPKVPTKRMVFHEITAEAIRNALNQCRDLDEKVVRAQEARRILDRLVGYTLSPLLWKKISWGLSAGRVQSVAVKLLVNREQQRRAFKSGSYWDLKANLFAPNSEFPAQLVTLDGIAIATGKDFDQNTGQVIPNRQVKLLNQAEAAALKQALETQPWQVCHLESKPSTRKPSPPFTTSTLQQEANRKLHLSARDTMRTAQSLYEQGYITYMRTDSVHLSAQAIAAARTCVEQMYGANYLSPQPRQYHTKSKSAQEAHEAIRPAGETFRTPQQSGLTGREYSLYDLIWKRTVACQMADARQILSTVQIKVDQATFRATGKRIEFPGFFRAYVEGSDDPESALDGQEVLLPDLKVGDLVECRQLQAIKHDTQPPARYTEASLVKTLESEGIGRPSTYASIIGTICDRGYAQLIHNALVPTFTAFAVTALLENNFPNLVDPQFTSKMEAALDHISTGSIEWLPYLQEFYLGDQGLEQQVKMRESQIDPIEARTVALGDLHGAKVRVGQYGAYIELERAGEKVKANIPRDLNPCDLNLELIDTLLQQKLEGPDQIGIHPETQEPIFLLIGQYGPYVQLGAVSETNPKPRRASLPKTMKPEELNLETAVQLLRLPRILGLHPQTGKKIEANLGRFGPYISLDKGKEGKEFRSLKGDDSPYTITLERALELLAQPKTSRGATMIKALGTHQNKPVELYNGKYGTYIKWGKVNVSLPKETSPETITLENAIALLATKQPAKPGSKNKAQDHDDPETTNTEQPQRKSPQPKSAKPTKSKSSTHKSAAKSA